jgi:hypothetical protein
VQKARTFVGRKLEVSELEMLYANEGSQLGVLFGRRRVGKTRLLEEFATHQKGSLFFEAQEDISLRDQIRHAQLQLSKQQNDAAIANVPFQTWGHFFDKLTEIIEKKRSTKMLIILDELQWMASGKSTLISQLKYYWDKNWSKKNVMLVLCGSMATFMVEKVIRSKALYGRIDFNFQIKPLHPNETHLLLNSSRSDIESLTYQLIIGRIPKYYEWINRKKSLEWNINNLCFTSNGLLVKDFEKTFYKQFKGGSHYHKIIDVLAAGPLTFKEISDKAQLPTGGGLKSYLNNLEMADVIRSQSSIDKSFTSKMKKYYAVDEFLCFYKKYIEPNLEIINKNETRDLFSKIVTPVWLPWLGLAFERFCGNNAEYLSEKMGLKDQLVTYGPFSQRGTKTKIGFQIDMIYRLTNNNLVIVEMKNHKNEITPEIISEVEIKRQKLKTAFPNDSIQTALISIHGPTKALKASKYFDYTLKLSDLLK